MQSSLWYSYRMFFLYALSFFMPSICLFFHSRIPPGILSSFEHLNSSPVSVSSFCWVGTWIYVLLFLPYWAFLCRHEYQPGDNVGSDGLSSWFALPWRTGSCSQGWRARLSKRLLLPSRQRGEYSSIDCLFSWIFIKAFPSPKTTSVCPLRMYLIKERNQCTYSNLQFFLMWIFVFRIPRTGREFLRYYSLIVKWTFVLSRKLHVDLFPFRMGNSMKA